MRNRQKTRRGIIAVIVAICLVALLAIAALAIDGGMLVDDSRQLQSAADAAALAAGIDLYNNFAANQGLDAGGTAKSAALLTAAANGFAHDNVNTIVTVNIPPTSGTFAGIKGYAEVIITYNEKRGFSAILDSSSIPIIARCVARGKKSGSDVGILVMNPTTSNALTLSGSSSVTVNGKVVVNSSDGQAAATSGGSTINATQIIVTGGSTGSGYTANTIQHGAQPMSDPLADMPVPDGSGMPIQSTTTYKAAAGETLQPGVYMGGIEISSKPNVTMTPGTYILQGGGLNMSGGTSSLTANGVLIYNGAGSDGHTGNITISGGGSVNMSPPTSGTYAGLAIFQDRNATGTVALSGGSNCAITGTIYAAKAKVDLSGSSGATLGSQYICDTLNLSGGSTINQIDPTKGYGQRDIRLIE